MEPSVRDAAANASGRAWGANDPEDQRLISKAPKRGGPATSSQDVSTSSAHMSAAPAQKFGPNIATLGVLGFWGSLATRLGMGSSSEMAR